jgi:nucleoside-diphosphate-sugar epimerase
VKALVIGGTGFVGVATCKELMRRGVETIAASRTKHPYGTFTSHVAFDRRDDEQLAAVLEQVGPDVIVDLACPERSHVEAVAGHFRGSRYVVAAQNEMTVADGVEVRSTAILLGAVFGAGDPSARIAAYLQRIEDAGPLLVPEETWERPAAIAWVKDAGYALALATDVRKQVDGKSYDVGFEDVSLKRLIEMFATAMGRRPRIVPIPASELPPAASPYATAAGDVGLARRELGFEPSSLQDAIAETLAWYRVAKPRHPGYSGRRRELEIAAARGYAT